MRGSSTSTSPTSLARPGSTLSQPAGSPASSHSAARRNAETGVWLAGLSTTAQPAANAFAAQEVNQFNWDNQPDFLFGFFGRAELEARAGGHFSWNTGVDYRKQLSHSVDRAEVEALYKTADLSDLWLIAEVQEEDIGVIVPGEQARASFVAFPGRAFTSFDFLPLYRDVFRQFVLHKSHDEIGQLNGWHFHRDGIHLNSRSGKLLADLVQEFLSTGTSAIL